MILGIKGETYHADDVTYFMLSERTVGELIDLIDSRIEEKGKVKGIEIEINASKLSKELTEALSKEFEKRKSQREEERRERLKQFLKDIEED